IIISFLSKKNPWKTMPLLGILKSRFPRDYGTQFNFQLETVQINQTCFNLAKELDSRCFHGKGPSNRFVAIFSINQAPYIGRSKENTDRRIRFWHVVVPDF
ncbi:hypothetical protein U1Q18_011891, partial [Sarracenia purpurea var. burkii]